MEQATEEEHARKDEVRKNVLVLLGAVSTESAVGGQPERRRHRLHRPRTGLRSTPSDVHQPCSCPTTKAALFHVCTLEPSSQHVSISIKRIRATSTSIHAPMEIVKPPMLLSGP